MLVVLSYDQLHQFAVSRLIKSGTPLSPTREKKHLRSLDTRLLYLFTISNEGKRNFKTKFLSLGIDEYCIDIIRENFAINREFRAYILIINLILMITKTQISNFNRE